MIPGIVAATSATGGGTPPVSSELVLDFANATYTLDGAGLTQADVLEEDAVWWEAWGGTVGADGLTGGQAPKLVDAIAAPLLTDGFTAVVDLDLNNASDDTIPVYLMNSSGSGSMSVWTSPTSTTIREGLGFPTSLQAVPSGERPAADGAARLAFTFVAGEAAISSNGNPSIVIANSNVNPSGAARIYMKAAGAAVVSKIRFIAPVASTDLPALSAL